MVLDASKFIPAEAIEKLPAFDDKCIDLVVTALPGFTEKGKEQIYGTSYSWDTLDDYIDYMDKVFTEVYCILKNQRYCVVMTGDHETVCGGDKGSPKKYPLAAYFTLLLESVGFTYVGEHIWDNSGKRRKSGIKEIPHYPVHCHAEAVLQPYPYIQKAGTEYGTDTLPLLWQLECQALRVHKKRLEKLDVRRSRMSRQK